jgi:hypothetical protein
MTGPPPGLAALYADDRRGDLTARTVAIALAALAHLAVLYDGFAGVAPAPHEPPPKVTEIELAPPPPPPAPSPAAPALAFPTRAAARDCLARKTFAPARDRRSQAVSAVVTIRVRFSR